MRWVALVAILCACGDNAGVCPADAQVGPRITWKFIAPTQGAAVIVVSPPNDPRLFVVEQQGRIKIVGDHALSPVTPSSIHAAANGEIYMTTTSCCGSSQTGGVYRLEAAP
jgi:hypothetical protein